ncbi:arginase family protein [Spirosoma arcticum]
MKPTYQLIEAPSILGLVPSGVELLPYALQRNGFLAKTPPSRLVAISVTDYSPRRASRHDILNASRIAEYASRLADVIRDVRAAGQFPVVLGGDCSILLGCMLALREEGTYGLAHVDAHADFYQPEAEEKGEAASMDLALVVGRGPDVLTNIRERRPYVQEKNVVQLGQRDAEEANEAGSQRLEDSAINCFDLATIRRQGVNRVLANAVQILTANDVTGYWIHFDVDVLADEVMPAVDYRIPAGLSFAEVAELLRGLLHTGKASGLSISIFNPKLDVDGQLTRQLVDCLHRALLTE